MKKDKIIKLSVLNLSIMLVNILVFSNAFFKINLAGGNALTTAFGIMTIVMSIIVFGYGNFKLLAEKPAPKQIAIKDKDINTLENCEAAVEVYITNNVKTYSDNLKTVITQINRMKKKKQTIRDILSEKFSETELSYERFMTSVDQIEKIMIMNIKSLLNRINAFDEEEYEKILENAPMTGYEKSEKLKETRLSIYNEYKAFVNKATENNEEILIKLDKLILELSKLNTLSVEDIEELDAMAEIDSLIRDAKWYK